MKKIKSAIVIVLIIAGLGAGVWGDRQLDARYSDNGTTIQNVTETTVE
ncbi:MAG: hypothetical protein UC390_04205 [Peptococcaceae bacterium]|nr:hypothetical protein [Peptococcaceae bacterium]MEE0546913.1 hypothetical protein [Peptococcaceae bacterium]